MIKSKWIRPVTNKFGIHLIFEKAVASSHHAYLLGNGLFRHNFIVHAYREIGTAVEICAEVQFFDNNKMFKCTFIKATL